MVTLSGLCEQVGIDFAPGFKQTLQEELKKRQKRMASTPNTRTDLETILTEQLHLENVDFQKVFGPVSSTFFVPSLNKAVIFQN